MSKSVIFGDILTKEVLYNAKQKSCSLFADIFPWLDR